jgi:hypothetical protein
MDRVRAAAHDECLRGFAEQRNPYGIPWAPRKKPRGWAAMAFGHIDDGHPILDKTGNGVESLTSRTVGDRAVFRMVGYMRFHQTGAHHNPRTNIKTKITTPAYDMPARKIFPEQAQGLGTWSEPVRKASVDAVREMCEGRR